jgi:Ni/Co efflux regulator RcnB
MSRTLIIAALAAFVATPAAAAGNSQSAPAKESRAAADKSKATKYCLTYERTTGSRIEKTECRTKAEWAQLGVNLDDLDS